jgi:hypothetical protein
MNEESPRRVEARRGSSIVYKGKTLLSLINPEGQAAKIASAAPIFKQTLYICASPLSDTASVNIAPHHRRFGRRLHRGGELSFPTRQKAFPPMRRETRGFG